MKDERMEDVEWEWLKNGNREVDKVMYDLEWENRNRREIRESNIIPQIRPQT